MNTSTTLSESYVNHLPTASRVKTKTEPTNNSYFLISTLSETFYDTLGSFYDPNEQRDSQWHQKEKNRSLL